MGVIRKHKSGKGRGRYFGILIRWIRPACIILIAFDFTTTVFSSIDAMKESTGDTIARTESQISQYIQSVWNLGDAIAAAPATKDESLLLRQRAQQLIPHADAYDLYMLGITNREGLLGSTLDQSQITSTAMLNDEGISDLSSRPAFQEMMATGKSILTDIYPAGADGKTQIYTIWIPYYTNAEIAGAVTVSIKFDYIYKLITETSLEDHYYFTLLDSRNQISANGDQVLVDISLKEAYAESRWASLPLEELENALYLGEAGGYWGINNDRLEYVNYMPVSGTPWKLIMRTDFFGSFCSTFYSLGIKLLVYMTLLVLFSLRKSRDSITRERLFNMMTGNVNEVFLAYNINRGRMEYTSSNSARVLGITADEWLKHPDKEGAGLGLQWEELERNTLEDAFSVDTVLREEQTGRDRPFRVRVYKVFEDNTRWAVMVITDETEEREKQRALKKALKEAERASQAKSDFLSGISHDIRTPLNAIVGMVSIALSNLDNSRKVADCLEKVQVSSRHLLDLISGVLDMSRIESGKMELNSGYFDLGQRIQSLYEIFRGQADDRKLTFILEMGELHHNGVIGDQVRFGQIIINLLSNALKYTEEGGCVKMKVEELPCESNGCGRYRITVSDNGIGMGTELLERLFEPFERAEQSSVSKIQGTGLGLSIVKQLVNLMGGEISVESKPDIGSRFTVILPFNWGKAPGESGISAEKKEENSISFSRQRILLVEDNEINMEIARELLEMNGLTVETAWNGNEAVEKFRESPHHYYSMIITDIQMPNLNGYEETRIIRAMDRPDAAAVPVVAMTADATLEARQRADAAGMNGYITKPVEPAQLVEKLAVYLKA